MNYGIHHVRILQFTTVAAGWSVHVVCVDREDPAIRRAFRSPVIGWAVVELAHRSGGCSTAVEAVFLDHTGHPTTGPEYRRLHDEERVDIALAPPAGSLGVPPINDLREQAA